jgi:outer membrane protein OmpA-like peptidoglycan-associated protein
MNFKIKSLSSFALAGCMLSGCATTTPTQLIEARDAYARSSGGLAGKLTPTEMYDAKKALDKADVEFASHGDTLSVRDYAYIASRKIELADVKARTEQDRTKIAEAVKAGVVVRDSQVKNTQAALASTREQLKDERRDSSAANDALRATNEKTSAQLEAEKAGRLSAEGKLAGAMKDLETVAAVRAEPRGVVITLSGGVLFASGKYALLNTAMTKLDQVATALKAQEGDKRMVVEGHTDSQGTDATNQPLSQNRATAVRDYLVSKGVSADKIYSIGMGSSRPITDNATPENRANNRHVEIIIGTAGITTR